MRPLAAAPCHERSPQPRAVLDSQLRAAAERFHRDRPDREWPLADVRADPSPDLDAAARSMSASASLFGPQEFSKFSTILPLADLVVPSDANPPGMARPPDGGQSTRKSLWSGDEVLADPGDDGKSYIGELRGRSLCEAIKSVLISPHGVLRCKFSVGGWASPGGMLVDVDEGLNAIVCNPTTRLPS